MTNITSCISHLFHEIIFEKVCGGVDEKKYYRVAELATHIEVHALVCCVLIY